MQISTWYKTLCFQYVDRSPCQAVPKTTPPSRALFDDYHLLRRGHPSCAQSVGVDSRRHSDSCVVIPLPGNEMLTGAFHLACDQRPDLLATQIKNVEVHQRVFGEHVVDGCARVERIRIILFQRERCDDRIRFFDSDGAWVGEISLKNAVAMGYGP